MCYGETLETRLKWHLTDSRSQVFKHKNNNPKINLIVNRPSRDKKRLEKVKNEYIRMYAETHGNNLEKCQI